MKKTILAYVLFGLLMGLFAYAVNANTLNQLGQTMLSSDLKIYRQTIPAANTIYVVTLEAGSTASINIHAVGADVRWCLAGTTTEAYWTIPQDSTFNDSTPIQFPVNTKLYFWSTSTSTPEVQVLSNYR